MAAITAFREPQLVTDLIDERAFGDFDARRLRYALYWAFYENTAYRDTHGWSVRYRAAHSLYKSIRNVYNPSYRLAEFWVTHLLGGLIDPDAGDGTEVESCLPILTENDSLRPALAQLWEWSRWQVYKDVLARRGAVFGDVGIRIVDDTERKRVYMEVVQPSIIKSVTLDPFGNVKAYVLEEERDHPDATDDNPRRVTYTERASRDGDSVIYETLLDGTPYAWNGVAGEWTEPYGFVPFVVLQHNNVGLDWGWSEIHPARSKIHELDGLASALDDEIMKMVNAPWLIAGQRKPRNTPEVTNSTATTGRPDPNRDEKGTLWVEDPNAKAQALVSGLDIEAVSNNIAQIIAELEREYPELQMDIWSAGSDTSGRALRIARQRVEAKVQQRRVNYDHAVVRAQQMAIAIGGYRQYDGFAGFDLSSYGKGDLDHTIAKRAVFSGDPLDDLEIEQMFVQNVKTAKEGGIPLVPYLTIEGAARGWDEEAIKTLTDSPAYKAQVAGWQMMIDDTNTLSDANAG